MRVLVTGASGFVGRYVYAQIPRSLNETALSLDEIEKLCAAARADLARQQIIASDHLADILQVPNAGQVEQMSMARALVTMVWRDLLRPFQTAALRRAAVVPAAAASRLDHHRARGRRRRPEQEQGDGAGAVRAVAAGRAG